jgi:hypothetical protein
VTPAGIALSLLGVALTGLISFLIASRRMSGRIATTEAADLWKESGDIRRELSKQLEYANDRIGFLSERVAQLEEENRRLRRQLNGRQHE